MTRKTRIATLAIASAIAATGLIAVAGDLTPPAGPISPTHKTLTEVEPRIPINAANTPGDADSRFRIAQRGSYYLTGDITGVAGKHGVEIAASGVTLDLNGFDMSGIAKMGLVDGVSVTVAGLTHIAVVNGSVRGWGDEGVDLTNATNSRVEGVLASGNGNDGIRIGTGSTVSNCSASGNTGSGIFTNHGCTVVNCSAYLNTSSGISTGVGGVVTDCAAFENTGDGIRTNQGCMVSNCAAYDGAANGIDVSVGSTVVGCLARSNILDGIECSAACLIRANTCSQNGGGNGAGIHATGADNRIEDNNCTAADRGIDVDAGGNLIIRNACSGNTINWVIVANNVCGPILDRTAPASAAINGNSAPDSTGSTHPNANFSY